MDEVNEIFQKKGVRKNWDEEELNPKFGIHFFNDVSDQLLSIHKKGLSFVTSKLLKYLVLTLTMSPLDNVWIIFKFCLEIFNTSEWTSINVRQQRLFVF